MSISVKSDSETPTGQVRAEQTSPRGLTSRIDVLSSVYGLGSIWSVSFPTKNGHPGLGVPGYDDKKQGRVQFLEAEATRIISLKAAESELLGTPHTLQSEYGDPTYNTSPIYSELQVRIDPSAEQPLSLWARIGDAEPVVVDAILPSVVRKFADVCIGAAEKKSPEPPPVEIVQDLGATSVAQL